METPFVPRELRLDLAGWGVYKRMGSLMVSDNYCLAWSIGGGISSLRELFVGLEKFFQQIFGQFAILFRGKGLSVNFPCYSMGNLHFVNFSWSVVPIAKECWK